MDIDEALRGIAKIRAIAAGLSRSPDDIYLVLSEVYSVGCSWLKSGQAKEIRDGVIRRMGLRCDRRVKKRLFRFLIEVGYDVNVKLRSRYANALRYAHDCPCDSLREFLKSRGGIEQCDKRFRVQQKKQSLEANKETTMKESWSR
jgi:hypothetical protein